MSRILSNLKGRRVEARNNRAIARGINHAANPAMRDELIIVAQRFQSGLNR